MTPPTHAREIAQLLARHSPSVAAEPSEAARAAGIAVVQRAIMRRRLLRRGFAIALPAVAALASIAAAVALFAPSPEVVVRVAELRGGGAMVVTADGAHEAHADGTLPPGAELITADSGALVTLSSGTRLALARATRLEVQNRPAFQRFSLHTGSVHAKVARVPTGEHFSIVTPDAEVEVHGTSFRVEVNDAAESCSGSRTRVFVDSGVVSVRHGATLERLVAGSRWPADCPAQASPSAPAPQPAAVPIPSAVPPAAIGPSHRPSRPIQSRHRADTGNTPASPTLSTLGEQNEAFGSALAAARRGDREAAVKGLSALLERYPDGALAESAAAERLRLLIHLDRARAHSAAQDYLARYPDGSATAEAVQVLGNTE